MAMLFVPVVAGLGGFVAGYVTSRYKTPTIITKPLLYKKEDEMTKIIPQSIPEELKKVDMKEYIKGERLCYKTLQCSDVDRRYKS